MYLCPIMTCVHPLKTDLPKPVHFTDPFCYEPHPLCLLAVEEVKQELVCMPLTEGKMFGVMVVERSEKGEVESEKLGFLAAYSGLLEGRNDWSYFVPPVFDAQQPDGYFKTKEREIMQSADHKELSLVALSTISVIKCPRRNKGFGGGVAGLLQYTPYP